ncbi:dephospho-CoA kinase [Enterococcus moraviensis ATCC BAA-383]|uniref:Dephospho-CoA kinase n=1 Tax=Enterococcus moraviensis ATCC BAA-383 TaxID=1158609 RepID=R2T2B4_9ENTE|nr:dephospho-CoA kinase [Enterococcus moraviensis]EOH99181.1 dephospho-CoA kinase [Enterococcus moraviensis ATCC BAA-383]EOT72136.1 dephospho-CoA kinase [Enterococcus moraviensis ATCC BAA-383]OJG67431.1 dephospho-CoA kinase [Enterococcus moraviensis]
MGMVLGLTGGIATGKSTVVAVFKSLGFPIVDADIIAREIVEIGTPGLKQIVLAFGSEILNPEGSLDRKKLGEIIFSDETKRKKLNELLSPFLKEAILNQIAEKKSLNSLVLVDIPLLFEGGYDKYVDKVAVVYVPEATQLVRLMERDHLTKTQAQQRIASQMSIEEKKLKADIVFDNQNSIQETEKDVKKWIAKNIF